MSMSYIRKFYGVPARRGMRVKIETWLGWQMGTITAANHYVHVRPDGIGLHNVRLKYHPTDVMYVYV